VTRRGFGMHGDTAVAPDGDGDRERDQLADLRPEQIGLLARGAQRLIALDCIGADFGNFADSRRELLAISIPVEHGHVSSSNPRLDKAGGTQDRWSSSSIVSLQSARHYVA
jgi:hypothetical protein